MLKAMMNLKKQIFQGERKSRYKDKFRSKSKEIQQKFH